MRVIGVDVGGSHISAALLEGESVLAREYVEYAPKRGRPDVILHVAEMVNRLRSGNAQIPVGVAMAGIITQGVVVSSPNLYLECAPVESELRQAGVRAHLLNDANAAAFAEWYSGAGKRLPSVLCVTVGTGIGSGLVVDGKIVTGLAGRAGEIGHMLLAPEGPACSCGSRGCVESLASASAIVRRALEESKHDEVLGRALDNADRPGAREVFAAMMQGSARARQVVYEAATWLGIALANVVCVVDPCCVVIGGGVAQAGDAFTRPVFSAMHAGFLGRMKQTPVLLAEHGQDAGVIGAALYAAQVEANS